MSRQTRKPESGAPTMDPPARGRAAQLYAGGGSAAAPTALSEIVREQTTAARLATPALTPPARTEGAAAEEGIAAWLNDRKIEALWSDSTNANSWVSVSGVGWRKLFNANESALLNLTLMCAQAEQANATVNVRVEADNMIHEVYVW